MTVVATSELHATTYDRADCEIGIVHLGFGAFHRAHQAVYIDDYMNKTGDLRWGIAAVNLRSSESKEFFGAGNVADGYLLKTMAPGGLQGYRLVRPHLAFMDWSYQADLAESLLCRESVHMISITVTESGYRLNRDRNAASSEDGPIYHYLAGALERRARVLGLPVTILCCDNIRANGRMLEQNFLSFLELTGRSELAGWVRDNATFPCAVVDRITPRTTEELRDEVERRFPGRNLSPVHGETFSQWVIEDRFAGPAPRLADVGVEIVENAGPYEEAKIRILNGGHSGLCYMGALAGYRTFDQAMADAELRAHFDGWEDRNVLPGLNVHLPFDKARYRNSVAERFENRAISDNLSRICMDGWAKMPIFVRPTLESCLAQGISPRHGYDCVASWYVFARRVDAGKMPVPYDEPHWERLKPLLVPGQESAFAENSELWAGLPRNHDEFVPSLVSAIDRMERRWPA